MFSYQDKLIEAKADLTIPRKMCEIDRDIAEFVYPKSLQAKAEQVRTLFFLKMITLWRFQFRRINAHCCYHKREYGKQRAFYERSLGIFALFLRWIFTRCLRMDFCAIPATLHGVFN